MDYQNRCRLTVDSSQRHKLGPELRNYVQFGFRILLIIFSINRWICKVLKIKKTHTHTQKSLFQSFTVPINQNLHPQISFLFRPTVQNPKIFCSLP